MANWLIDNPVVKPVADIIAMPFKLVGGLWNTLTSALSVPVRTFGGVLEGFKWGPIGALGGFLIGGAAGAKEALDNGKEVTTAFIGKGFETALMTGVGAIGVGAAINGGKELVTSSVQTVMGAAQTAGSVIPSITPSNGQPAPSGQSRNA